MEQQNNFIEVDLQTGETYKRPLNISDKQIDASATILANILLDYVKSGGAFTLSPSGVFGKGEHNE